MWIKLDVNLHWAGEQKCHCRWNWKMYFLRVDMTHFWNALTILSCHYCGWFVVSNKAQTPFPRIRKLTGISYDKLLFLMIGKDGILSWDVYLGSLLWCAWPCVSLFISFDSNWGDHCGMVAQACKENGKSVVTHRTPNGLRETDWRKGLELYRKAHLDQCRS